MNVVFLADLRCASTPPDTRGAGAVGVDRGVIDPDILPQLAVEHEGARKPGTALIPHLGSEPVNDAVSIVRESVDRIAALILEAKRHLPRARLVGDVDDALSAQQVARHHPSGCQIGRLRKAVGGRGLRQDYALARPAENVRAAMRPGIFNGVPRAGREERRIAAGVRRGHIIPRRAVEGVANLDHLPGEVARAVKAQSLLVRSAAHEAGGRKAETACGRGVGGDFR